MSKALLFLSLLVLTACGQSGPEGTTPGDCSDGKDNDLDGMPDCDDDGCTMSDHCVALASKAAEEEQARADARAAKEKAAAEQQVKEAVGPFLTIGELVVQRGTNDSDIDWNGAEGYCKALALGGKAGWRLPTAEEAVKLVESGQFKSETSYVMWTSTKKGRKRAQIVGISSGAVNDLALQYKGQCRVRCVLDEKD